MITSKNKELIQYFLLFYASALMIAVWTKGGKIQGHAFSIKTFINLVKWSDG